MAMMIVVMFMVMVVLVVMTAAASFPIMIVVMMMFMVVVMLMVMNMVAAAGIFMIVVVMMPVIVAVFMIMFLFSVRQHLLLPGFFPAFDHSLLDIGFQAKGVGIGADGEGGIGDLEKQQLFSYLHKPPLLLSDGVRGRFHGREKIPPF